VRIGALRLRLGLCFVTLEAEDRPARRMFDSSLAEADRSEDGLSRFEQSSDRLPAADSHAGSCSPGDL
jgi:hypothetical protein